MNTTRTLAASLGLAAALAVAVPAAAQASTPPVTARDIQSLGVTALCGDPATYVSGIHLDPAGLRFRRAFCHGHGGTAAVRRAGADARVAWRRVENGQPVGAARLATLRRDLTIDANGYATFTTALNVPATVRALLAAEPQVYPAPAATS